MSTLHRPPSIENHLDPLFAGPGEMRARCRAFDWAATPLGPPASWSASLRSAVGIALASPVPMWIGWGPDHRQIFNDAYLALAERSPATLGAPAAECGVDRSALDAARAGAATVVRDRGVVFRCSPIPDPAAPDGVGGVLAVGAESARDDALLLDDVSRALAELGDLADVEATLHRIGARIAEHFGVRGCTFDDGDGEAMDDVVAIVRLVRDGARRFQLSLVDDAPRRWSDDQLALARELVERIWSRLERARAEQALRDREARYRMVFDSLDEAFAILEVIFDGDRAVDLRYLEANPAAERMSGIARLAGRRLLDFAPGIQPYWLELFGRVAKSGVGERHELPASPSGRTYDVFLFKVGAPHEMHVASIAHDVSERARRRRQESLLAEISLDLVGLTDIEPTLARLGERIGRFFGAKWCRFGDAATPGDPSVVTYEWSDAGRPSLPDDFRVYDVVSAEQLAAWRRGEAVVVHDVRDDPRLDVARCEEVGVRSFVFIPFVRDGEPRLRLAILDDVPRRWNDAEIALLHEIAERIGLRLEHARVEEELRASEERFRTMTDVVPDLLWQREPDGAVPWYNARWYEYTGQSPAEARHWGWIDAVHPDDRERWTASYAHDAERGGASVQELRIRRHDGAYRWFLVRAEPLRDAGGRVVHWLGAATDVHAQRTALEEVEYLIAERTSERDTLRRQLAGAEEAERRRLARELHDQLGQQLTAIALGTSDALRLAAAHDGAYAAPDAPLLRRLEGLQTLAREMQITTRYLALELRPPELDDVGLESALETYVHQWSARYGVAAEVAATGLSDRPLPTEVGSTLYRIAQEALTNVAKHAAASQVSVIVERRDSGVQLVVEDDGRGFDVEQIVRRARTERRFGLAGIQERAMLVGGSVTLESSPGQGTTLFVRLPADAPATPSAPPLTAP